MSALIVNTWRTEGPASHTWAACLNDYDEGVRVFTGATQRQAINELLDYHEQDDGQIYDPAEEAA